jgi:tRNA(fMet)-specific endonuclease VapC
VKLLDTDFLIDLQRERVADVPGPAHRFLERHADEEFAVSVVSVLEFLEGYDAVRDGEAFLEPFDRIEVGERIARRGSRIRRTLRRQGTSIGDFDILIAATAFEMDAELVTANAPHFERVKGLSVAGYR